VTDLLSPSSRPTTPTPGPDPSTTGAGDQPRDAPDHAPSTSTARRVVIDTSVLIADPESLLAFVDDEVVIPLVVIEELDGHKTRPDDVGRAARQVLREIEELRVANGGDIRRSVRLPGGGTLRIETNGLLVDEVTQRGLDPDKADNRILAAALGQARQGATTVVSNDAALRIKAAQMGLEATEHQRRRGRVDDHRPAGWTTLDARAELIDELYTSSRPLTLDALDTQDRVGLDDLEVNQFAVVRAGSQSALVRRRPGDRLGVLRQAEAWGLHPRSKEQQFALELLTDPEVAVVALDGMAGTGKTILALAAGLEQVMEQGRYDKLAVYRPVVPVGKAELGFLPGTLDDKLDPWMTAVTDALVALTDRRSHADARALLDEMTNRDKLSLEAVTYLRGRTLQGTYVVVDEAQNLEPTTLKTILTRVGEGTKIVFTGDTSQIDAPYLSEHTNAVAVLIDAFEGESVFGHVRLMTCERSEVASLAAIRL
jgi:PhoH-like ATPase